MTMKIEVLLNKQTSERSSDRRSDLDEEGAGS
jgi:hypothetical protein